MTLRVEAKGEQSPVSDREEPMNLRESVNEDAGLAAIQLTRHLLRDRVFYGEPLFDVLLRGIEAKWRASLNELTMLFEYEVPFVGGDRQEAFNTASRKARALLDAHLSAASEREE